MSRQERKQLVDKDNRDLSIKRQCELLDVHRSGLYYQPCPEKQEDHELMQVIDKRFLKTPHYGSRRMAGWLRQQGYQVKRKRVRSLMNRMGLRALRPKPKLSIPGKGHPVYPYLLRNLTITRPGQVWATDITYVPMEKGHMYLMAIMDLYSRYVVNWSLSNTMDSKWVSNVVEEAIDQHGAPEIMNSDQGSQFTSEPYLALLKSHDVKISMDGKGRAIDNIFIERLWRSVKYEEIYARPARDGLELYRNLKQYFWRFNEEDPKEALGYQTASEYYYEKAA
jgi:putative transposase